MTPETLTFQWLTPILIACLAGAIAIIGKVSIGYLSLLVQKITSIDEELKKSNEDNRKYFKENDEKHHNSDIRISRLEEHIPIR